MGCDPVKTRTRFTVIGAELTFQYDFNVDNSLSSVVVEKLEPEANEFTILLLNTDYTIDTAGKIVTINDATKRGPVGTIINIRRCTQRARGVEFQSGSIYSPTQSNRDQEQDFSFQQELEDVQGRLLGMNDRETYWDGRGLPACNFAPGTRDDCLITLAQLNQAVFDGEILSITEPVVLVFDGDGITDEFVLTGVRQSTAKQWFIFKNGVSQLPQRAIGDDGDFDVETQVAADDKLVFEVPPEDETKILAILLKGSVIGSIEDDTLDGDELQNDSIGLRHLNIGAGAALRFLVFDALGDPVGRIAVHTDISDFDAGVRTTRLDQMAIPTSALNLNATRLTNVLGGSAATDAVVVSQLPANTPQMKTGSIAAGFSAGFIEAGFKVVSLQVTYKYATHGGENHFSTINASFRDTSFSQLLWPVLRDSADDPDFLSVTMERQSVNSTKFRVVFSAARWAGISGLLAQPTEITFVALGAQ